MKIQRKFAETDQLDVVEGLPKLLRLGRSSSHGVGHVRDLQQRLQHHVHDDRRAAALQRRHTSNQAASANTQSNRGTSAASAPNLEAARQASRPS
jgi:hypothetical protein